MSSEIEEGVDEQGGRGSRRLPLPALILVAGLLGALALVVTRPQPERVVAPRLTPVVSTVQLIPRTGPLLVEGAGTVRPASEITLSAEVSGRVLSVSPQLVRGGSFARGDTLLVIERQSYRNAVSIARADVEQRLVDLALATQNQVIAREEYELLRARTGRAPAADTTLASRLAQQQPQFDAAEASLARAEASLGDALLALDRTVVTAPFSGRVRSESVDVGQVVSPGQGVAEIYGTDAVEVDISLSTRQAVLVGGLWDDSRSDRISSKIRMDFGGTAHEWDGSVVRAAGALDPTTRTVEIVVRVPEPFGSVEGRPPLLIGSYVRASIEGRSVEGHYAIPRNGLRGESSVWIVDQDGTMRSLPISVIQEVQDTVFIQSELPTGTDVVVSDLTAMTEGMEVRIAGSDGPSGGQP